ncbi:hypothetical protein GCM10010508_60480 [Streptomyces naganishii JCM 4654]|uniref:Uncharacterized protein n=1 Tax=Streptomyces naganishii JCM 4654 TaxID=1306179 RepID=A0A918Y9P7_9ACTN|nr:hypothetical protein GCM10010508_60480 [Streptomyces naganishii JCM 4654]
MVRACPHGSRRATDGAVVPLTPAALAKFAAGAVTAGATLVHVRPRTPCDRESLFPRVVAATPVGSPLRHGRCGPVRGLAAGGEGAAGGGEGDGRLTGYGVTGA